MTALDYNLTYADKKTSAIWSNGDVDDLQEIYICEIDEIKIFKNNYPDLTREYSRTLGGPSFFMSVHETQFYHFLSDGIANFLYLRTIIPDLKIYFINDQPGYSGPQMPKDFVDLVIKWCQEEGYGGEVLDLSKYKKINVDKLFVMANANIMFLENLIGIQEKKQRGDISNYPVAKVLLLPLLKEFIYKKALEHNRLPEDFNYPSRVYLRPGLTFERMQAWKDQFEFLEQNNVTFDGSMKVKDDPNNVFDMLGELHGWKHIIHADAHFSGLLNEVDNRYLSKEEVSLIDSFFERRDYFFLDSESMAWIDILNMIIKADKVALISGAAVLNAMIAEEGTQIIYLEFNTSYDFDHPSTLEIFFKDPAPFFYYDRREVKHKRYEVSRVLSDLENERGDFL